MSLTAEKGKVRRAFEVARELKVETPTVLEFLVTRGLDTARKQMQPVDEETYVELLRKFDQPLFRKYQTEQGAGHDDDQKRDSVRLREAEIEMLKAVKEQAPPPDSSARKIELPRPRTLKVVERPVAPPTPQFPAKAETKPSPARTEVASGEPVVAESRISVKQDVPPIAPVAETPIVAISASPVAEAAPLPPAPLVRRKIELPQTRSLTIIEHARPKPPPPRQQPQPQPQSQKGQQQPQRERASQPTPQPKPQPPRHQEARPPSLSVPVSLVGGPGQAGKKKLKRKKLTTKVETPEDAIETQVEAQMRREVGKAGKPKPGAKPAEIPSTGPAGRHRRKKKGKPGEGAPAAGAGRGGGRGGRKPRVVDQQAVTESIKKTMAMMDGRGKGRHHYVRGGSGQLEEVVESGKLRVTEFLTTQELANMMDIPVQDVIKRCIEMGMIISINQRLDRELVELLAAEFEAEVEFVSDEEITPDEDESRPENLTTRQPIVTVMGHVDHGKTTLLDHLRRTRVAEKEYGGITQHIGAYEVIYGEHRITFLDTPGHEAFTAMRARGAQLTDIVILVVAADDRVMPQTLEAIDHSKAAGVPIVVAVNKVDKANADPEAIYKQLADANLLVEKWGGKHQSAEISAKFGQGMDDLLQEVIVAAELLELKADSTIRGRGVVIESRLDKGLGVVATVLIQNGTLKIGDPFVVGQHYGRVRALYNEAGEEWVEAGPARPVQVIGFSGVPQAGDKFVVYPTEKEAREISLRRQQQQRELSMRQLRALSLENMSARMKERDLKDLPLVIKGDVHGSVEVLADALMKLSTSEVKVNIIHRGVGGVTESDILLASASGAIVIGFHVHPNPQARELARQENVEIRSYRLIHEVVDDIRLAMEGLLAPTIEQKVVGQIEVRKVFRISRLGSIAGCYMLEGKVNRNSKVRLIRDAVELWSGELSSLKRFKDDAREVVTGFECGISLNGYNDILEGDRIEVYEVIEKSRKLEDSV